jgi:hypothetical protein
MNTDMPVLNFSRRKKMTRAKRFNSGKPRLDLLPLDLLTGLSRVLEYGEGKYGRNNWRQGAPATEQVASLLRHLQPIMEALNDDNSREQFFDPESGMPHVDHILFNVISLRLALEREHNLSRDPGRPKDFNESKKMIELSKEVDTSGGGC